VGLIGYMTAGCGSDDSGSGGSSSAVSVDNCAASASVGSLCDSTSAQSLSKATVTAYDETATFDAITSVSDITTGVKDYRISYQTQYDNYAASPGKKVTATGRVLLPDGAITGAPLLIWGHGTTGTADKCAPSSTKTGMDKHAYQYAARGFVVFAPDYSGLGVDDEIHYYLVKEPTALSIWDGAYAAKEFVTSQGGSLSGSVVLLGHSQGGQAVLFAHQYYEDNGANSHLDTVKTDFTLKATVAAAPAPQWIKALAIANSTFATALGVTDPTLAFMLATSYIHAAADYYGLDKTLLLSPATASAVGEWFDTKCQTELGGMVEAGSSPMSSDATAAFQSVLGSQTSGAGTLSAAASACLAVASGGALSSCKEPGTTTAESNPADLTTDIAGWYGLAVSSLNATGAAWGTRLMIDGAGTSLSASSAYGQVFSTSAKIYITQGAADDLVPSSLTQVLYSELAATNAGKVSFDSVVDGDHTASISTYSNSATSFSYVQKIFEALSL
jgi:dienelactone hydrolase